MSGMIVCDFDNRCFADDFESWDAPTIVGGGTLTSGVMIETGEAGLIHYESGTGGIELVNSASWPNRI